MPTTMRDRDFRQYVVPELDVLLRVARRLTGKADTAEDLVQETLIRAYRAVDRFDGRYPRAWLLTIRPASTTFPEALMSVGVVRRRGGQTSCRTIRRLLQSFLDREATDSAAFVVASHLDDCRRCGLEEEVYRWLAAALARTRVPEDPERRARLQAFADGLTATA